MFNGEFSKDHLYESQLTLIIVCVIPHHHHLLKKVDSSFNDITENKISHLALNRNCLLAQPTIYHGAQFY
jgi:hypothetical protein